MTPYETTLARRVVPDAAQTQLLVGTLLGRGRLVAGEGGVGFVLTVAERHVWLADWTYARLAPLVPAPVRHDGRVEIRAEPHPVFAELAVLLARRRALRAAVGRDALWVWAVHRRVTDCERADEARCGCAGVRPPRRSRALPRAS